MAMLNNQRVLWIGIKGINHQPWDQVFRHGKKPGKLAAPWKGFPNQWVYWHYSKSIFMGDDHLSRWAEKTTLWPLGLRQKSVSVHLSRVVLCANSAPRHVPDLLEDIIIKHTYCTYINTYLPIHRHTHMYSCLYVYISICVLHCTKMSSKSYDFLPQNNSDQLPACRWAPKASRSPPWPHGWSYGMSPKKTLGCYEKHTRI